MHIIFWIIVALIVGSLIFGVIEAVINCILFIIAMIVEFIKSVIKFVMKHGSVIVSIVIGLLILGFLIKAVPTILGFLIKVISLIFRIIIKFLPIIVVAIGVLIVTAPAKAWVNASDVFDESLNFMITFNMFETSTLPLEHHPIKRKTKKFKARYLYILTFFVEKYSNCIWSNEILSDYYAYCFKNNAMLEGEKSYSLEDVNIRADIRKIFLTCGWRKKRFYKQLLLDVLYVCKAMDNKDKGDIIFSEIASYYSKPQEKFINTFYKSLYIPTEGATDNECEMIRYWKKNREFLSKKRIKVLVTANMSAGKSTLVNAIVGKKVNQTQNDSCTKKVHYIFNRAYYDGRNVKYDSKYSTNVSIGELLRDNDDNKTNYVYVGTSFVNSELDKDRVLLIDTPGVNTYSATEHKIMTEQEIEKNKTDILLYVMNATNIGTDDENKQLIYIQEHFEGRIIFAVNKLDKFNAKEDSVCDTLEKVKKDLTEKGFENPEVFPTSAYAAYLAEMKLVNNMLDEDEQDEFERILRKMKKQEYQFDTYYPADIQECVTRIKDDVASQMLFHSGILQLENIIKQERIK